MDDVAVQAPAGPSAGIDRLRQSDGRLSGLETAYLANIERLSMPARSRVTTNSKDMTN
jgi:hypothetical protein